MRRLPLQQGQFGRIHQEIAEAAPEADPNVRIDENNPLAQGRKTSGEMYRDLTGKRDLVVRVAS